MTPPGLGALSTTDSLLFGLRILQTASFGRVSTPYPMVSSSAEFQVDSLRTLQLWPEINTRTLIIRGIQQYGHHQRDSPFQNQFRKIMKDPEEIIANDAMKRLAINHEHYAQLLTDQWLEISRP